MKQFANLAKATLLLAAIGVMGAGMFASPAAAARSAGPPVCCEGTFVCAKADNTLGHFWL